MTKEERDFINSVTEPLVVKDHPELIPEILIIYNKFKYVLPKDRILYLIKWEYFHRDFNNKDKYYYWPAQTWASLKWTELMYKNRKCSNPDCDWECPWGSALEYHYCVKCGKLLPYREEIHVVNESDYKNLSEKAEMSVWGKIKSIL